MYNKITDKLLNLLANKIANKLLDNIEGDSIENMSTMSSDQIIDAIANRVISKLNLTQPVMASVYGNIPSHSSPFPSESQAYILASMIGDRINAMLYSKTQSPNLKYTDIADRLASSISMHLYNYNKTVTPEINISEIDIEKLTENIIKKINENKELSATDYEAHLASGIANILCFKKIEISNQSLYELGNKIGAMVSSKIETASQLPGQPLNVSQKMKKTRSGK